MKRLLLLLPLVACSAEVEPLDLADEPATLSVQGNPTGATGTTVPVTVAVADAEGRPVPAVEIHFAAEAGDIQSVVSTDNAGNAVASWTLPAASGVVQGVAQVDGLAPAQFSATVTPVAQAVTFRFLDAGGYHACGITATEQLLCWGYGADGQLGIGQTGLHLFPTLIPGDFRYRRVTGGYYHACAFTLASNAWCWGNNSDGRLGSGGTKEQSDVPVKVFTAASIDTVQADTLFGEGDIHLSTQVLQAGWGHTCGIDLSQHVWCWGRNGEGQLGRGNPVIPGSAVPVATLALTGTLFKSINVGGLHTCGITTGGDGMCWGYNVAGQLGDGTTTTTGIPGFVVGNLTFRIDPLVIFRSPDPDFPLPPGPFMATGYDHTCAITIAGPTVCWGLNQNGQLGDNTRASRLTPTAVAGGHSFAGVTAGLRHTCALDTEGAAWCWGANDLGQLGIGPASAALVPTAVEGGLTFAYLKAGELFTCGVTSDGAAYCWGDNEYGQLGDGTTNSSAVPVKVAFQP